MSNEKNRPAYNAFTVRDIEGQEKAKWTQIGIVWEHEDGEGFNIDLDALPVNGRIILRKPKTPQ